MAVFQLSVMLWTALLLITKWLLESFVHHLSVMPSSSPMAFSAIGMSLEGKKKSLSEEKLNAFVLLLFSVFMLRYRNRPLCAKWYFLACFLFSKFKAFDFEHIAALIFIIICNSSPALTTSFQMWIVWMHCKCMHVVGSTVLSEEEGYCLLNMRNKVEHFEIKYFVIGVCTSVLQ